MLAHNGPVPPICIDYKTNSHRSLTPYAVSTKSIHKMHSPSTLYWSLYLKSYNIDIDYVLAEYKTYDDIQKLYDKSYLKDLLTDCKIDVFERTGFMNIIEFKGHSNKILRTALLIWFINNKTLIDEMKNMPYKININILPNTIWCGGWNWITDLYNMIIAGYDQSTGIIDIPKYNKLIKTIQHCNITHTIKIT
jgi:hypothetical protein